MERSREQNLKMILIVNRRVAPGRSKFSTAQLQARCDA
jgi:hypothetical protein